jgi:hypothetical protein
MGHVHHFVRDKNLLSAIFDQIGIARRSVLNGLVAVFDVRSGRGDHRGDVDGIFQHKKQLQGHSVFEVVVGLLQNGVHQREY